MKTSNISKLAGLALGISAAQTSVWQAHELTQQQQLIYQATCRALEASGQIDCNDPSVMQSILESVHEQTEEVSIWPAQREFERLQQYITQITPPEMKE